MRTFLVSNEESAKEHVAGDDEVGGVVGRHGVIVVMSDRRPSVVDAARYGTDVSLHVPVLGHG